MKKDYYILKNTEQKNKEWLEKIKQYRKKRVVRKLNHPAALLVIDMQNFFLDKDSHAFVPSGEAIIPNIKKLISASGHNNLPIVFTRYAVEKKEDSGIMKRWWNDTVEEGTENSKIIAAFKVSELNMVIRKKTYSAFFGTNLERILRKKNVKSLIITGVMTHLCCDTAAREAFIRDFEVYFVIDATATYNEELHLASLMALSHGFAIPVTTNETIKLLED